MGDRTELVVANALDEVAGELMREAFLAHNASHADVERIVGKALEKVAVRILLKMRDASA
jgi:hypothetical protein